MTSEPRIKTKAQAVADLEAIRRAAYLTVEEYRTRRKEWARIRRRAKWKSWLQALMPK